MCLLLRLNFKDLAGIFQNKLMVLLVKLVSNSLVELTSFIHERTNIDYMDSAFMYSKGLYVSRKPFA